MVVNSQRKTLGETLFKVYTIFLKLYDCNIFLFMLKLSYLLPEGAEFIIVK